MSDLVVRLSAGQHPVEVSLRPARTVQALKECLDRGYVHIRFTGTRGGTELGLQIDTQATDLTAANFQDETGRLTIVGRLTPDYVPVRCIAEIALPSLEGQGRLGSDDTRCCSQPIRATSITRSTNICIGRSATWKRCASAWSATARHSPGCTGRF